MDASREFDHIVLGGGTAGCVVAARLAERTDSSILVVEAGDVPPLRLAVPLASLREIDRFSWHDRTLPQRFARDRSLAWPVGRALGGSSVIHAMMYTRGHPRSWDAWSDFADGWSWADVLPYFIRAENQERGRSSLHGTGGPLDVSDPRHIAPFSSAFLEACEEIGITRRDDFNGLEHEGYGMFQVMMREGRRVSAASSYLVPALGTGRISIATRTRVLRLVSVGRRIAGAEIEHDGTTTAVHANRSVILCAGAIRSPQILMLSGIGPGDELSTMEIPVLTDLPGVGRNLQDHLRVPAVFESRRTSPGARRHWVPEAIRWLVARRGVFASNCCETGAFVRTDPSRLWPDLQLVTHFQTALHPGAIDIESCLVDARSRGTVSLASNDPCAPPRIDPRSLESDEDVATLVYGVRLACRIARTDRLARFGIRRGVLPPDGLDRDEDLAEHVRGTAETCFHAAGTCRIGTDPMAVVDPRLRVHGVDGLRVVDTSVMPRLINANTCAPTIMIAERAVDFILEDGA